MKKIVSTTKTIIERNSEGGIISVSRFKDNCIHGKQIYFKDGYITSIQYFDMDDPVKAIIYKENGEQHTVVF